MPKYAYIITETSQAQGEIVVEDVEEAEEIARLRIVKSINEAGGVVLNNKSYSIELIAICPVCEQSQDRDDAIMWTMCWSCRNEFQEEEHE
jgi:hypothetical protein